MASIANLPQGACLAQEVGDVGGETCGSARERAGFAPRQITLARAAVLILPAGVRGQPAPESASPLPEAKPALEPNGPLLSARTAEFTVRLRHAPALRIPQYVPPLISCRANSIRVRNPWGQSSLGSASIL